MSTGDPLLVVSDLHAGYGSLQAVDWHIPGRSAKARR